jgi:O-antigen/teichoic acid export membrane protein
VGVHAKWAAIPALGVAALAPTLFPLVFGGQWVLAGEFSRIMTPLFFVSFIVSPVAMSLTLLGRQKTQMIWDVGRLLGVVGIWLLIHHQRWNARWGVALHVAVNLVAYVVFLYLSYDAVRAFAATEDGKAMGGSPQGSEHDHDRRL